MCDIHKAYIHELLQGKGYVFFIFESTESSKESDALLGYKYANKKHMHVFHPLKYICVYKYMRMCLHIHIHTHIYVYAHIHIRKCVYIYIHTHTMKVYKYNV